MLVPFTPLRAWWKFLIPVTSSIQHGFHVINLATNAKAKTIDRTFPVILASTVPSTTCTSLAFPNCDYKKQPVDVFYVIVITCTQRICLMYMPQPRGCRPESMGIYIRQMPSPHVIYHFRYSNKNLLNLKTTAQLLYLVTDVNCDCRKFFNISITFPNVSLTYLIIRCFDYGISLAIDKHLC